MLYTVLFHLKKLSREKKQFLTSLLYFPMYLLFPVLFLSFLGFALLSGIFFLLTHKTFCSIFFRQFCQQWIFLSIIYLGISLFCLHFWKIIQLDIEFLVSLSCFECVILFSAFRCFWWKANHLIVLLFPYTC